MEIGPREATFNGLENWLRHEFEHLGWMVLANEYGMNGKIEQYKKSINTLIRAINHKLQVVNCDDKKRDLEIMLKKAEILQKHVNKDFPSVVTIDTQSGGTKADYLRRGSKKKSKSVSRTKSKKNSRRGSHKERK